MELIGAKIRGFRRFKDPSSVRLLENLIALIGQNESGKTSFLDALEELNNQNEIREEDQTRRVNTPTKIEATFSLEESDYTDLDPIEGSSGIDQCTFIKHQTGEISVKLDEKPTQDLLPREETRRELGKSLESDIIQNNIHRNKLREWDSVLEIIDSEEDYLGDEKVSQIENPIPHLENLSENNNLEDGEIEQIEETINSLEELAKHERNSPPKRAKDVLLKRRPKFLSFKEEDRDLKSRYDLSNIFPNPPSALSNLAELAGLDLRELKEAAESEKVHLANDLTEIASRELEDEFSKSWVRSDVVPVLDIDGKILHINVRTPDVGRRSPINQRSDGLRWFVALVSFLNQKEVGEDPVLLVDEAERHLSYDAQAELVEVLEAQTVAQKVVYTTHSAGCLPSDLGRGIRPVVQKEGERSNIRNGFWLDEPGFKPIMEIMGLNPLAFTVTRNSLIAEGPCETILLPTLIRQATKKSEIQYQIAPGAANVGEDRISELLSETGQSVILLDGDGGGVENKDVLVDAGAEPEKVKTYRDFSGDPLVLEDLIDLQYFVEAVNDELAEWQDPEMEMNTEDFAEGDRIQTVEDWCDENSLDTPSKVNVAQRLVKMAADGSNIVDSERKDTLCQIDKWASEYFVSVSES